MASHRLRASLVYPRRATITRSTTRVDYRSLTLVVGLLALAAFAGVLYLSQAGVAAELHFELQGAEWKARELWLRNLGLRQEIADAERLATIDDRVARMGMVSATSPAKYVACVVPSSEPATAAGLEAAEGQSGPEPGSSAWRGFLHRLGLVRSSRPGQLVVLNAEHP